MSAVPEEAHLQVRRLADEDLDRVMEIELQSYPYPWTRGIFADCLRVGYECWGVQAGRVLAGYGIFNHAAGESHLLNLCVAPQWRRRGLGDILLQHCIRLATSYGCEYMFLEVRPSNPAGFNLYRRSGFETVGQRKDYYTAGEGREDAVVMRKPLR